MSKFLTKIFFPLVIFFEIFVFNQYILSSPINVPLDHYSYRFIERFQAKGALKDYLSNAKPYSRDDVAKMIFQISALQKSGKITLSKTENEQLNLLKGEFAAELIELGMEDIAKYNRLVDWSNDKKSLVVQACYIQDANLNRGTDDTKSAKSTLQVVVRADLEGGFFLYSDNRASYTTEPMPIWHPNITTARYPWSDASDAYLIIKLPWTNLQIGKDSVLWGPGYHGVVGLSAIDPTFDLARFSINLWKVKLTDMVGFLKDRLGNPGKSETKQKYLFGHRLEFKPFSGACIAWQEVFIYDKVDISLINPIMPYQMAEDYLGQVGNNTMELDLDLCVIPNVRFYSALFLDDFHPDESLFSYTPNTWAILGGILINDPFKIKDSDFRIEYARVEPWAYSHRSIQISTNPLSYRHFDTPLGHWIGSNADDLLFEANHNFSDDLSATLSYNRIRTGEFGSSPYDYFTKEQWTKKFLEGIDEKKNTIGLTLKYRIYQDSIFEVGYNYERVKNKQKEEAKLPSFHKQKQSWEEGNNTSQNIVQIKLTLKY